MRQDNDSKASEFEFSICDGNYRLSHVSQPSQKEPLLDDKEVKKEKKNTAPSVSYLELFRYADSLDRIFIAIGSLAAIACGVSTPLFIYLFSSLAHIFTLYGRYKLCDLDYWTCFNQNLTFANESQWNATIQHELDAFEEESMVIIYYFLYGAVVSFASAAIQTSAWAIQANRHTKRLRIAYFNSIVRQDIGYHDVTSAGELNERLTSEMFKIREGVGEKFSFMIQYSSCCVAGLLVALFSSWKVTLVILAIVPFMGIAQASLLLGSSVFAKKEQEAYNKAGSIAKEAIMAIRTVVAFGCQRKEVERYSNQLGAVKSVEVKRGLLAGFSLGMTYFTWTGMYSVAFWYGTTLILNEEINVSDLMIAIFEILIGAWSLGVVATFMDVIAAARAAGSKVFEVIDRVPEIDISSEIGTDPSGLCGDIVFKNVHFHYPSRPEVEVLKGVTFSVKHDTSVALVGQSGAGKSTVVQLLQRFYDCQEGSIQVGGKEIKSLHLRKYREMIGVVAQEPVLFATTIAENIRWGRERVTDEEMIEAAKQANAYDFIMKLPEKFDTLVGEGGGQMSGGQKQRIAIARAIARNPKILLLDEATSALDTGSESIVQAALEKASAGRTSIIVAHRLSTIRNAKKIVAFQNGTIREHGSHEELLKIKNGVYANLVNMQASILSEKKCSVDIASKEPEPSSADVPPYTVAPSKKDAEGCKEDEETNAEGEKGLPAFSLSRIWKMNRPEWPLMAVGCFFSLIAGSGETISAILISEVLLIFTLNDRDEQMRKATFMGLMFLVLAVVVLIACTLEATIFAKSGVELTIRLRRKAFSSVLRQNISYFDDPSHSTGALCARLSTDALRVQGCTGVQLGIFLKNISTLGLALSVGFAYGWKLTLVTLASVPFVILASLIESELLEAKVVKEEKLHENAGQVAVEAINNVRTVASLTKESKIIKLYAEKLYESTWMSLRKVLILGGGYGFSQSVYFFSFAATFRLAIELIQTGEMSFENTYKVLIAISFGAVAMGMNSALAPDYAKAKWSARKMFALYDSTPSIDAYSEDGIVPDNCKGKITFHSVLFSYPSRADVPVLKHININVQPGQTLALVGQSGSGKSTSVHLIERFYDPQEGQVTLDGTDISKLNVSWLRQQMGLVSQEPVLFDQSIEENIRYGDCTREASDSELIAAAKNANIHSFITSLSEGYATNVGTKGGQLSGGQKQRVAIARALLRNPKILLLDEATSALDTESEKIVQDALDAAREGRTSIIIAHRLSTVKNADQIAVIDNGVVVEVGTHKELISKNGAYFSLVNAQLFV